MFIGAIADDLTGASDLSLVLSRSGMKVVQVVGIPAPDLATGDADAVVISLKSRTIPAAQAVEQSLASARVLLALGAQQIIFKYCSTFDSTDQGNIGPVTEALMQLLGETRTIACPAFPANGRRVYRGHLFVGDQLLSESGMKDHPLTPMRDANLPRVLQRQCNLPVSLVPHEVVADAAALQAALDRLEGIAVVDALTDADLRAIGQAARNMRLVTGSSGVALGLPDNFLRGDVRSPGPALRVSKGGAVILAGSCSGATRGQVAKALAADVPAFRVDAMDIAEGRISVAEVLDFVLSARSGTPPLVYSSANPASVQAVQSRLGRDRSGSLVEEFFGTLASDLLRQGVNRFVVAGGETSGAVVTALRVRALQIGPEIAPGVPWTCTPDRKLALALKSGNFGADDFFLKAWDLLP
ncbi:four-carbon acid sugar kinase family protein [Paracoccus sp. WLY502]|uniref:3-oxo-tetronate kinase n=1 Tax=Paracoccus yibinensis TaxID=3068891 RepID=UPI0027967181|nr:3-oxo-tetronate kinase [Paracoccus sp. WLY502]MDQ1902152.1 four-carbon acid sugar kinase family protein [Paracoccus sp. WLY502]